MSLKINPVLCRAGVMDNYAYIITDSQTGKTAVIDASEAAPVIKKCEELNLTPEYILTTHHHFDHVGGNLELKEKYNLKIIGSETEKDQIEACDAGLTENDVFHLGDTEIRVIEAPGHTIGHILFYVPQDGVLFTGDVLFNLCVGGLFEGTPRQMWESLQKIKSLPDDTLFYPGHEYTRHCMAGLLRQNNSQAMQLYAGLAADRLSKGVPVSPIKLGLEKQCNPYLAINSLTRFEQLFS